MAWQRPTTRGSKNARILRNTASVVQLSEAEFNKPQAILVPSGEHLGIPYPAGQQYLLSKTSWWIGGHGCFYGPSLG